MLKKSVIRPAHSPVALAVLALAFIQPAAAQTAADEKAQTAAEAAQKAEEPRKLETVVVSGSRIKRDSFSSVAPVQIIRNDDATLAGFTSTAQVLQSTSVTGGQGQINNAFGGFVTEGGPGANTIGLRGFGPTRSLVLLNGRRMSPSGTRGSVGAADLNTLPSSIVDRIEVLKDGASSIYGSDAVAGVINVITKKNLTSITLDATTSRTQDGGGNSHNFAISGGHVTDNARFLASYQFNELTSLTLGQREWARCATDYRRTNGSSDWGSLDFKDPLTGEAKCYPLDSNGVTINTIGTANIVGVGAAGSVGTTFNRWRPNSGVATGLVGFEGVGGGANNLNVRDTFDPRTLNRTMISPVRSHNFFAQGGLDLQALGDAELYFEAMLNRRESSQVGYRQLSLDYSHTSPLVPANLQGRGTNFGSLLHTGPGIRSFIGFGNDRSSQQVDFGRGVVGLRGSLADTGWDYDVSAMRSESRGEYTFEAFLVDRMTKSVNVVASGNGFACVDASGGCVAAPALTSAVIGGVLPKAWVDYVWRPVTGKTIFKEDVVTASATGSLFSLPYGAVKGAVGMEYRRNSIDDTPGIDSQNGNLLNFTSATPTRGSDAATDVFAEVEVPLLKNLPFAQELTLNASTRWADYKSYGSDSTHKIGALWAPTKWMSLRGTNGTSYRAPALFEQFLGSTSGFLASTADPCNNWDAAGTEGTTRRANCQSEGLPPGFTATSGVTVLGVGGREAGLKAETSKNSSWGVIVQPPLPAGWGDLSMALDRFDIEVNNGVAQIGGGALLQLCYDDPQFRSGGGFCRLVSQRAQGSNALTVSNGFINLSTDIVRGYDFTARYAANVGVGRLRVNMTATKFQQQANKLFADDELDDFNGILTVPEWSGALDVNYTVKGWNVFYGLEYTSSTSSYEYRGQDPATSTFKQNTPSYFLHAASLTYKDSVGKWSATFGVRNLLDTEPPKVSALSGVNRVGNAPLYSGYDYQGRRFFVNVSKTF